VTQLLTDKNTQGVPKYQYKYTQTHNGTQTQSLIAVHCWRRAGCLDKNGYQALCTAG